MTLDAPRKTAMLLTTEPMSISAKASHATLGVAMRQRSKVEAQKYSTAISKKMIQ
jgi:hypothetical protein